MGDAPLILGFDTSGPWIGAVLLCGNKMVAEAHLDLAKGQGEQLFPVLENLLAQGDATWRDLGAVGVGVGPGNFTGIRISVSAARGLGLSLEIPVVGVSLLEAFAYGRSEPRLASVAAPRDHAYIQGFETQAKVEPQLIALDDLPHAWEETGLICVGTASPAIAERIEAKHMPPVHAPGFAIASIAAQRMHGKPPPPVPMYLKPADAAPSREAKPVILDDT